LVLVYYSSEKNADLALLPMTTTSDYWEAIINKETNNVIYVENQLHDSKLNIKVR
jgi:hypothetical protein